MESYEAWRARVLADLEACAAREPRRRYAEADHVGEPDDRVSEKEADWLADRYESRETRWRFHDA